MDSLKMPREPMVGICFECQSQDLWRDTETYVGGCNDCGASYQFRMSAEFSYERHHFHEVWKDEFHYKVKKDKYLEYMNNNSCPLCPDQKMNRFELMDLE